MSSRFNPRRVLVASVLSVLLVLLVVAATQQPILRLLLQQDADGGGNSFTNLLNLVASNATLQRISGPATNQFGSGSGSLLNSSNYVNKIGVEIFSASNSTNYWWDFGLTNDAGPIVYQTVFATNNVNFLGVTNVRQWAQISMNVVARSADRTISIPTNLPHLNTNGLQIGGSTYRLVLTNGNEFRITIQSNITLSTIWTCFGQGFGGPTNGLAPPTNFPTDGYSIHATGPNSKWSPDLNLTNSRVTGYIPYATGADAKWDSPPAAGGSNNVLQSLFSYPVTYIHNGGNYDFPLFFANFGNVIVSTWQSDGSTTLQVSTRPNSWASTSANQLETHRLILIGSGSNNTALTFDGIFMDAAAPTNLATNEVYDITISHIGGQTNWIGISHHVTNFNAFRY